jgi:signal transduction histidine kinase
MKKFGHVTITLALIYSILLFLLGGWWLYLLKNFGVLNRMLLWEGGTFFIILILISFSLLYFIFRDIRKNKAMAIFFSSLTHELKTPLASIRLQAEAMEDLLKDIDNNLVTSMAGRLIEDTQNLETQMDKILQLSKIELGGPLRADPIHLKEFLRKVTSNWGYGLKVDFQLPPYGIIISGDEMALELVFKNLFENTRRHSPRPNVEIIIDYQNPNSLKLIYKDQGIFDGDRKKIGTLFYRHKSKKGSGIGLYLIKKLIQKMKGTFSLVFIPTFTCTLELFKFEEET